MNESNNSSRLFQQILLPLLISIALGIIIFFSGDAFQILGVEALENTLAILGNIFGIVEFLTLAVLVQRVVQYVVIDRLVTSALGAPAPRLLSQISGLIIYAMAIAAIAGVVFKKDLTVVMATVGGAGIVIGLALQRVIQDLFAGLNINLDQTLKKGYHIRLQVQGIRLSQALEGEVQEISWRTTELLDNDGNTVLIPNNVVTNSILTNFSIPANYFKLRIPVMLDFSVPVEHALSILKAAALEASPGFSPTGAPTPSVTVSKITPHGVSYTIAIYPSFKTRIKGRDLLLKQVLRHLAFSGYAPAHEKEEIIDVLPVADRSPSQNIASLLGNTQIFQDLAEPELLVLVEAAIPRELPANTIVVEAGELATFMFFVVEGLLIAKMRQNDPQSSSGEQLLGPGTLMNSIPLLAGGSYPASIRTKTVSRIYEINASVLEKLFRHQPACAQLLSHRVAEQIRENNPRQDNNIDTLTAMVFKHIRRSFSYLQL